MEEETYSHYSGSRSPSPSESGTQYARRACNSATWIHEEVKDMGTKLDEHIAYFKESMESIVPALEFLAVEARMNKMQNIAAGHKELAIERNLNARLDAIEKRLSDRQSLSLAQTLKAINTLKLPAKVYCNQETQTEAPALNNQCSKQPQIFSFSGNPGQALEDERLEGGVGDRGPGPRNQDRDDSPEPKDPSETGDTSEEDTKEVEPVKLQVQERDDEQSSARETRPIFLPGVGERDEVPQENPSEDERSPKHGKGINTTERRVRQLPTRMRNPGLAQNKEGNSKNFFSMEGRALEGGVGASSSPPITPTQGKQLHTCSKEPELAGTLPSHATIQGKESHTPPNKQSGLATLPTMHKDARDQAKQKLRELVEHTSTIGSEGRTTPGTSVTEGRQSPKQKAKSKTPELGDPIYMLDANRKAIKGRIIALNHASQPIILWDHATHGIEVPIEILRKDRFPHTSRSGTPVPILHTPMATTAIPENIPTAHSPQWKKRSSKPKPPQTAAYNPYVPSQIPLQTNLASGRNFVFSFQPPSQN
jgi:hypothetical protein